jgi:cytochrome c-type biogenesis protein
MRGNLRVILHTVSFSFGLLTFLAMVGLAASWFQPILFRYERIGYIIAGLMLIFFGLVLGEWVPLPWLMREYRVQISKKPVGFIGSYLIGLAFTAGWTPCVGPILGSVFALAIASKASAFILFLSYGIGLSLPFILVGFLFTYFMSGYRRLRPYLPVIVRISSVILILTGVLLFFGGFAIFSERLSFIPSLEFLFQNVKVPTIPLAFAGGVLSFISPCLLPIVPSFLAYIAGVSLFEEENHS